MSNNSKMEKHLVVLEIKPYIDRLISASQYYTTPRTIIISEDKYENDGQREILVTRDKEVEVLLEKPIDKKAAYTIVVALVNEIMGQYLRYRIPESPIDVIASVFTQHESPSLVDIALAESFLCLDGVDECVVALHDEISGLLLPNVWRQWDLIATGSMIVLLGGEDHRILEWNRQHPELSNEADLSIDILELLVYINNSIRRINPKAVGVISANALIMDTMERLYPYFKIDRDYGKGELFRTIPQFLGMSSEAFFVEYLRPLFKSVIETTIRVYTTKQNLYRVELTPSRHLVFYSEPLPKSSMERYYSEIRASIDNGDWVPERERRSLYHYERSKS